MIRTAEACRQGLRDGREVRIDNERVSDVARRPAFKPIIDVKARMYDMGFDQAYQGALIYFDNGAPLHPAPPAAAHGAFDFTGPLDFVREAAPLSDTVTISES